MVKLNWSLPFNHVFRIFQFHYWTYILYIIGCCHFNHVDVSIFVVCDDVSKTTKTWFWREWRWATVMPIMYDYQMNRRVISKIFTWTIGQSRAKRRKEPCDRDILEDRTIIEQKGLKDIKHFCTDIWSQGFISCLVVTFELIFLLDLCFQLQSICKHVLVRGCKLQRIQWIYRLLFSNCRNSYGIYNKKLYWTTYAEEHSRVWLACTYTGMSI